MICARCGGAVRQTAVGWGHVVNPGPRHHYVKPREERPVVCASAGRSSRRLTTGMGELAGAARER